ncbi:heparan sulfate glucosamine 3-O-sulfotransferase 1-like [Glandiceps talaboti]
MIWSSHQISKILRRRSLETYMLYAIAIVTSILIIRFIDAPRINNNEVDISQNESVDGVGFSGWFQHGALFPSLWEASTNVHAYIAERLLRSCYVPVSPFYNEGKLMKSSELSKRGCEQRLPQAIIGGVRRCGASSLYKFLKIHPSIVGPNRETGFFASLQAEKDEEWYQSQMPFSTNKQVTMDFDTDVFHTPTYAPKTIAKYFKSNVKIIFVFCNPVERALVDYVPVWRDREAQLIRNSKAKASIKFQASVLDKMLTYKRLEQNEFLDVSIYVQHIIRWLQIFPLTNIHFVDGDVLKSNPTIEMRKIEDFLGVRNFFLAEHFFYNDQRSCYCTNYPMKVCPQMKMSHPELENYATERLCETLQPFNTGLAELLNRRFSWMGHC